MSARSVSQAPLGRIAESTVPSVPWACRRSSPTGGPGDDAARELRPRHPAPAHHVPAVRERPGVDLEGGARDEVDRCALGTALGVDPQLGGVGVRVGVEAHVGQVGLPAVDEVEAQPARRDLAVDQAELRRPTVVASTDRQGGVGALEPDVGEPPVIGGAIDVDVSLRRPRVPVGHELDVRQGQAGVVVVPRAQHPGVVVRELRGRQEVLDAGRDDADAEVVDVAVEESGAARVVLQHDPPLPGEPWVVVAEVVAAKHDRVEGAPEATRQPDCGCAGAGDVDPQALEAHSLAVTEGDERSVTLVHDGGHVAAVAGDRREVGQLRPLRDEVGAAREVQHDRPLAAPARPGDGLGVVGPAVPHRAEVTDVAGRGGIPPWRLGSTGTRSVPRWRGRHQRQRRRGAEGGRQQPSTVQPLVGHGHTSSVEATGCARGRPRSPPCPVAGAPSAGTGG